MDLVWMSVSLLMYLHNSLSSSWNSFLILPSILGQNFSYGIFNALYSNNWDEQNFATLHFMREDISRVILSSL